MKRPMKLANMEAISVLNDENPASRAASLNLPGESALGEDGTAAHTFPALFPPFADSPLGPFVVEEDFFVDCWRSHFLHISWERGAVRAGTVLAAHSG